MRKTLVQRPDVGKTAARTDDGKGRLFEARKVKETDGTLPGFCVADGFGVDRIKNGSSAFQPFRETVQNRSGRVGIDVGMPGKEPTGVPKHPVPADGLHVFRKKKRRVGGENRFLNGADRRIGLPNNVTGGACADDGTNE